MRGDLRFGAVSNFNGWWEDNGATGQTVAVTNLVL